MSKYRNFIDDTWKKFLDEIEGKKLWIWGAGVRGKEILLNISRYALNWNIAGFIDSNEALVELGGYRVLHPDGLDAVTHDDIILISVDKPGKIAKELEKLGLKNYYSYYWLNSERRDVCENVIDEEKVQAVLDILTDEKSKDIFSTIVEKRREGFLDYTDIQEEIEYEYFSHGLFEISDSEVFIDGGAFEGDTVRDFILYTGGRYKKIYSFEPDKSTYMKLNSRVSKYRDINCYELGLSDKEEVFTFINDNSVYSSHILDSELPDYTNDLNKATTIQCDALDNIVKDECVTYIKLDIEGAEMKALMGAKNIIVRDKPKLAICIYHKPNDLWEIPLFIHDLLPEYKMYLRHNGDKYYDTVLFCAV